MHAKFKKEKYFTGENHICCPFTGTDIYVFNSNEEEHKWYIDYKMQTEPKTCGGNCAICPNTITIPDEEYSLMYFQNWKYHMLYYLELSVGCYFLSLLPWVLFCHYHGTVWWAGFIFPLFSGFFLQLIRKTLLIDTDKLFKEWTKEKYKEKMEQL